jgi:hypothetical protein
MISFHSYYIEFTNVYSLVSLALNNGINVRKLDALIVETGRNATCKKNKRLYKSEWSNCILTETYGRS